MADIELSDLALAGTLDGSERLPGLQNGNAVAVTSQQIVDRARQNMAQAVHTHTTSNITDFTEGVQDAMASALTAGDNITIAYDDAGNKITISANTGGVISDSTTSLGTTWSSQKISNEISSLTGGVDFQEAVEDLIGASIVAGTNITKSYDDATGKTTISAVVSGGSGGGDLIAANNLSDIPDKALARTNLGLGTAATQASAAFATAAQGTKADTAMQGANNLSEITNQVSARTNLGLGTAATQASTAFATAAQGAKADTAVQPGSLAAVATSGSYDDLTEKPNWGSGAIYYGTFTGDGSTATFNLTSGGSGVSPGSVNAVVWDEGGVLQGPGTDFTLSGSVITRTTAPTNGISIKWYVLGQSVPIGVPSPGAVDGAAIANGAVGTTKLADAAVTTAKLASDVASAISSNTSNVTALQGKVAALETQAGDTRKKLLTVTNALVMSLPAGYTRFRIDLENVLPSVNGANMLFQVSTDGGATWIASNYKIVRIGSSSAGASVGASNSDATSAIQFCDNIGNVGSRYALNGRIDLTLFDAGAGFNARFEASCLLTTGNAAYNTGTGWYSGVPSPINAIKVYPSSGTLTGTAVLYGEP